MMASSCPDPCMFVQAGVCTHTLTALMPAPCRLVHRLDRNVSGVMVVGRSAAAAAWLSAAFRLKSAEQVSYRLVLPG
jgi:23S rRNA-/tRNA-specific pseudouridylate synthase